MQLYTTTDGIARREGDELCLLDVPLPDLGAAIRAEGLEALAHASVKRRIPLGGAKLLPPVPQPGKFVIIGVNYRAHAAESGMDVPTRVLHFAVSGDCVNSPDGEIVLPARAPNMVDYEGEIAIVIGRRAESVRADEAWSYVAGITAANDVSARDLQEQAIRARNQGPTLSDAKAQPGFKPLGPGLITSDELARPLDVRLRTWVNGDLRQDSRTSDLVFDVPAVIEQVSAQEALEPGDVICTGSPAGVGRTSNRFLKPGDMVEIELEGLPRLRSKVVAPA